MGGNVPPLVVPNVFSSGHSNRARAPRLRTRGLVGLVTAGDTPGVVRQPASCRVRPQRRVLCMLCCDALWARATFIQVLHVHTERESE